MSIAIVKDDFHDNHSSSWSHEWLKTCRERGIDHELVDWRSSGAIDILASHDIVLWHFNHYSSPEMLFTRTILRCLKERGCRVFPDIQDSWHYDDKVAQAFLFGALNLTTPRNYVLLSPQAVENWIKDTGEYPIVAKLRAGSGSSNVRLIHSDSDLRKYTRTSFGRGFPAGPSIGFKIASNFRSSRNLKDIIGRLKRAPEFIYSFMRARDLPREKGYVYLQEFVAGAKYDIKAVVIGNKMGFIGRRVREGDFRASGGSDLFGDKSIVTQQVIETAFAAADAMRSDCAGFDIVVSPNSKQPYIVEVSFGFSHKALMTTGGYFDRSGSWHDTPLNAPVEIMDNLQSTNSSDTKAI